MQLGYCSEEPTKLYYDVLRTFNNGLMESLYWQFLRYLNYFYPNKEYGMVNYMEDGLLSVEIANRMKAETDAYYYSELSGSQGICRFHSRGTSLEKCAADSVYMDDVSKTAAGALYPCLHHYSRDFLGGLSRWQLSAVPA